MNAKPLSLSVDSALEELTLSKNLIMYNGTLLGKFNIDSKEINVNKKEKVKVYYINIFCKDGKEVAQYDFQFAQKSKKNAIATVDATLKTTRDNVNHNPSNFLDFNEPLSEDKEESEIIQFKKVVKYLMSYQYF